MIPTNWNSITVEQYLQLKGTMEVEVQDCIHALDIGLEQYRILTGDLEADDTKVTTEDLGKIRELIESEMPTKIIETFELNGIRYKARLHPSQLPARDYITIMNLAKKGDEYLHQILFTIYRPLKKKRFKWVEYDFEAWELKERINDFKGLTMEVVNPLRLFFLNVSIELTEVIQVYLDNQMKTMTKELESVKEDLLTDMDG